MTVGLADLDGELHVWISDVSAGAATRDLELLDEPERARFDRYIRDSDRQLFLHAHAFTRKILSRYVERSPASWQFERGVNGRPEVAAQLGINGLRFNLSHTPGLVALLVHGADDAGIDVEQLGRVIDLEKMSRSCFTPDERGWLASFPVAQRHIAFSRLWTLKESFMKATGLGMRVPLQSFWFDPSDEQEIKFGGAAFDEHHREQWQFKTWMPTDRHVAAVGFRSPGEARTVRFLSS